MELPPVSAEAFEQKVIAAKAEAEAANADTSMFCEPCHKRFGNKNAYDNHLSSKKHKEAMIKFPEGQGVKAKKKEEEEKPTALAPGPAPVEKEAEGKEEQMEVEEVESDEWEDDGDPIPCEDCLFCKHHSRNIQANLQHMMVQHSFFIPDVEYLTDVVDFLTYLGRKVGLRYCCLWCDDKRFRSLDAVQKHMTTLGHCKIRHEGDGLAEYSDFYDYTTSYPDAQGDEGEEQGDEEIDVLGLDDSAFELTLPSGAVIGHRSLLRYYKQKLITRTTVEKTRSVLRDVMSSYRMKGWTPLHRTLAKKKARDVRFMARARQNELTKMGLKNNKLLQRHFRAQTMF